MGREIRQVPANWAHPIYTEDDAPYSHWVGEYRPLYDENFADAAERWMDECVLWRDGKHPNQAGKFASTSKYYWEWAGEPPTEERYRQYRDDAREWFQVYETVSEGTPVTPPFATKEELVDYLVHNGDFWDQKRKTGGWARENAESFISSGFAMSLVVRETEDGIDIREPRDGQFQDQADSSQ